MSLERARYWSQKNKQRQKSLRQTGRQNVRSHSYKTFFLILLIAAVALPLAAFGVYSYQRTAGLEFSGNTITVKQGGNLQAALDRAKPGDTILLEAGAKFVGNFQLPNKPGNEFITIRSSAGEAQLPPENTRIDPAKYASVLPKLSSQTNDSVISTSDGAHHYRFIGIEFGGTKDGVGNIIRIGTAEEKRIEDLPHHIEFDRVYVHATSPLGQRRGIAANGRNMRIVNSYISGIVRKGEESQAITVWATDGPIEIVNNYLEAAAENILFGGAGSPLKLVPTDCIVRDNYLNKPLEWRAEGWNVKNLFEIKNGRRIKVENNLMTNNWSSAQEGTAVLFTTRADNGDATIIEDITFAGNIVRGSANALNVYGSEGGGGHNLIIRNNFFEDINAQKWGGAGYFMKSTTWDGLTIENNTIIQTGSIIFAYDAPIKNFIFRYNIVFENEYGIKGDNMGSGQEVIDKLFSRGTVTGNIIIGGKSSLYREKNFFPTSISQVGFVNAEKNDYRLRGDSSYINKGFGGKRIGADLEMQKVGGN